MWGRGCGMCVLPVPRFTDKKKELDTHRPPQTYSHIRAYAHTDILTYTHIHRYRHTHTHAHRHTYHTLIHTSHTHIHTHTHPDGYFLKIVYFDSKCAKQHS